MSLSRQFVKPFQQVSRLQTARQLAVRSFTTTPQLRNDGYNKHRVQVKEPSAATTDDSMKVPYVEPEVGKEPSLKPRRTLSTFSMEGKVCVVTGGARGIGHMISGAFLESGATQIAILDLRKEDAEKAGKEMVAKFGEHSNQESNPENFPRDNCKYFPLGVMSRRRRASRMRFAEIVQRFGKVDCVVNSAGLVENFPATEYPTAKVKKLVDVNILGSYFVAREAAKVMKPGSSIILIGSMSGVVINVPQPQTPYNFSKAAVIHMAKSLAVEWAPKGIRVNCISRDLAPCSKARLAFARPGYVLTNLTKVILDANTELRDTWTNMTPMADPNDLKGAVIYLGSDASAFTTGSNMM
ncbi:hypothetical protein QFC20_000928 [Naganishia adeliensis]|uniref:Uncharacterized protein n=1 Tax=Naganishia adeliensis TaxID=92952 RepID=A0ACC2WVR3_9TREE|nr:hypothetical protein QFC20_000928 [Naganishia adeliensis]